MNSEDVASNNVHSMKQLARGSIETPPRWHWPYVAASLTVLYGAVAVMVELLAPECIHEPCNSEGTNNSTSGWATDFFIALVMISMSAHLKFFPREQNTSVSKSGTRALALLALAFFLGGLGHLFVPNTGYGDNMLMRCGC